MKILLEKVSKTLSRKVLKPNMGFHSDFYVREIIHKIYKLLYNVTSRTALKEDIFRAVQILRHSFWASERLLSFKKQFFFKPKKKILLQSVILVPEFLVIK